MFVGFLCAIKIVLLSYLYYLSLSLFFFFFCIFWRMSFLIAAVDDVIFFRRRFNCLSLIWLVGLIFFYLLIFLLLHLL